MTSLVGAARWKSFLGSMRYPRGWRRQFACEPNGFPSNCGVTAADRVDDVGMAVHSHVADALSGPANMMDIRMDPSRASQECSSVLFPVSSQSVRWNSRSDSILPEAFRRRRRSFDQ